MAPLKYLFVSVLQFKSPLISHISAKFTTFKSYLKIFYERLKVMNYVYLLLLCFVLTACSNVEENQLHADITATSKEAIENSKDLATAYANAYENASALQLFFKEHETKATFIGDGNEFASFSEETVWLTDHIVQTSIENGEDYVYSIYRITEEAIELVYEGVTEPKMTVEDIAKLPVIELYLALPIEQGASFGSWTITDVDVTVNTTFKSFTDVIEVMKETDGALSYRYFAPGCGLIKQVESMETSENLIEISSTLEEILYE